MAKEGTEKKRLEAKDFPPEILRLFDRYIHGFIDRREFLDGAGKFAVGGMTAAAILEAFTPNYALGQQVPKDDKRLKTEYLTYPSPQGNPNMRGYFARPANAAGKLPGVLVIHENRGLNPHIEDIARRVALANYTVFAPDALTPLGGYPGDEEKAAELFGKLDAMKRTEDLVASANFLKSHPLTTGKIGVVGFCFGGSTANMLAVRIPDLAAAVPFYGGQPAAADVAKINAPLLIHYGGLDERVNAGWPAYEAALKANKKTYTMYMYEGANHGFNNDTSPRYDKKSADLAWERTMEFFNKNLRS